ncbi:MAG TPA: hypothetical protein VJ201_09125 [Candidatus Babeliales bacterium]|nr:hypothetical protein [Candidatus Babeliales bacterium]
MKPHKTGHEDPKEQREREIQLREKQRDYWRNRMKSSKIFKMSQGAVHIVKIIRDRLKWGDKDFPKNPKK